MRLLRRSLSALCALAFIATAAHAQAPIALPNTITTVAGGGTSGTTANSACTTGSPYKATDGFGDGCPATLAQFAGDGRGGLAVDGQGNIFIVDTNNNYVRWVNSRSGIVNWLDGGGTAVCSGTYTP